MEQEKNLMDLLNVQNLKVWYSNDNDWLKAVDEVSFSMKKGELVGLVGESGCGKSTLAKSMIGMIEEQDALVEGTICYKGEEILKMSEKELQKLRGREISYLLQNPMSAFNPVHTIQRHLVDTILLNRKCTKKEAKEIMLYILAQVGFPEPKEVVKCYPHQFSGGMLQRAALAMDMSILLITHNLAVVKALCDRVLVMYNGKIVEEGSIQEIWENPKHAYTKLLLESLYTLDDKNMEK